MTITSSTVTTDPGRTAEEILAAIYDALSRPRLVGSFLGFPVYAGVRVPDRIIEIRGPEQTVRFRLDDPYVKGSKLERDLR